MSGQSRNEPCNCGSGKKYKRCCIGSVVEVQLPEDVGRHLDELATEFGISPEQTLKRMLMLYTSERKGKPAQ